MSRCDSEYRDYSCESGCWCTPSPVCSCGCPGPRGADGKSAYQIALDNGFVGTEAQWLESLRGPFLSSYVEAIGDVQGVGVGQNIVFSTGADELDVAGQDIRLDASGTTFTITRAGLYHVEWSVNIASATPPVVVGLMEAGEPASGMTNASTVGNHSSGALINVTEADLPYTISLHNFGGALSLGNQGDAQFTSASIRILRFADGAN